MKAFVLGLLFVIPAGIAGAPQDVPVSVGGDSDSDACPSLARVEGVRTFLAVRSGPGASYRQVDALGAGAEVYVCMDWSGNGGPKEWDPIVYAIGNKLQDCGVSQAIPRKRPYRGPCRSGWVHTRWLKAIAG